MSARQSQLRVWRSTGYLDVIEHGVSPVGKAWDYVEIFDTSLLVGRIFYVFFNGINALGR